MWKLVEVLDGELGDVGGLFSVGGRFAAHDRCVVYKGDEGDEVAVGVRNSVLRTAEGAPQTIEDYIETRLLSRLSDRGFFGRFTWFDCTSRRPPQSRLGLPDE